MLEYLLKFPPFDNIARPIATEHDENTEIIRRCHIHASYLIEEQCKNDCKNNHR